MLQNLLVVEFPLLVVFGSMGRLFLRSEGAERIVGVFWILRSLNAIS